MDKNYELIRKVIKEGKYKVLEDDGTRIIVRYQMNSILINPGKDDDGFVAVMLPNFAEVNADNLAEVVMRCHKLNETLKMVKLYTINDVIFASAEFYFAGKKALAYQIKMALNGVIAAKVSYRKMEK